MLLCKFKRKLENKVERLDYNTRRSTGPIALVNLLRRRKSTIWTLLYIVHE
jgi:hypothetical protein